MNGSALRYVVSLFTGYLSAPCLHAAEFPKPTARRCSSQ